jgi:hypothetical protein
MKGMSGNQALIFETRLMLRKVVCVTRGKRPRCSGNSSGNVLADLLLGRLSDYQESTKNVLHNIGFNTLVFYAMTSPSNLKGCSTHSR